MQPIFALDDIELREGHCSSVDVFNCDFENDKCGLENLENESDFPWYRLSGGSTLQRYTGPSIDHTVILNIKKSVIILKYALVFCLIY